MSSGHDKKKMKINNEKNNEFAFMFTNPVIMIAMNPRCGKHLSQ